MLFTNKTVSNLSYLFSFFYIYWFLATMDLHAQEQARTDSLPAFRDTLILSKFDTVKINTSKIIIETEPMTKKYKRLSAGPGIGLLSFYGDIRSGNIGDPNSNRFAFSFDLNKEFSSKFDLGIRFITGKLAGNEFSDEFRNFESKLNSVSFNLIYRFFSSNIPD